MIEAWALLRMNAQSQLRFVEYAGEWCPRVELYYPRYTRVVRPHGSRKAVRMVRAVYPGYVFARVDTGEGEIHLLTRLPVRTWWVRFGGIVETVPGSVIQTIKAYEARNELVREEKHVNPYRAGVRVSVHMDIADLLGTVVRLVNGGRVMVEFDGMGRGVVQERRLAMV